MNIQVCTLATKYQNFDRRIERKTFKVVQKEWRLSSELVNNKRVEINKSLNKSDLALKRCLTCKPLLWISYNIFSKKCKHAHHPNSCTFLASPKCGGFSLYANVNERVCHGTDTNNPVFEM